MPRAPMLERDEGETDVIVEEADISLASASNDFRWLLDSGLIEQTGRGRSTGYRASERLREDVSRAS